jgi:hypothetical protein
VTTRYLDRDAKFYRLVEWTYETAAAVNNQVSLWEQNPSDTEEWPVEQLEASIAEVTRLGSAREEEACLGPTDR